jgi:hypothetical protein
MAISRQKAGPHPHLAAPYHYGNAGLTALERAAAIRSGGRRSGITVLSHARSAAAIRSGGRRSGITVLSHARLAAAQASGGSVWADIQAMSLADQEFFFGNDQAVQPPDTQVAAGHGAVLEADNDTISIWSKTGALVAIADANLFFGVPSTFAFSDPRVLYDAQSGQWFMSGFSFDAANDSRTYLAVSATSDPTGIWNVYTVEDNSATKALTDQPMIGVCNDKVVMSWNEFIAPPPPPPLPVPVTLPITSYSHMLVDPVHQHIFFSSGAGSASILVTDYSGHTVATIANEPGATGLALSGDGSTVYAALANGDAISAISTTTLAETARYSTGAQSGPTYVAYTSGKIWFGYGAAGGNGGIGSIDPSTSPATVTLKATGDSWYSAPMVTANPNGELVAGEPGQSPNQLASYNVSSGTATVLAPQQFFQSAANLNSFQITPDGTDVVTASGFPYYQQVFRVSDLAADGTYPTAAYPGSVSISSNGYVAAGTYAGSNAIFVYPPRGATPVNTFTFGSNWLAADGAALTPDGSELFAVTLQGGPTGAPQLTIIPNPEQPPPAPPGPTTAAQTLVLQKSALLAGSSTVNAELFSNASEYRIVPAQSLGGATTTCWMTVSKADTALPGGSSSSPTVGVIAVAGLPNSAGTAGVTLTETDLPVTATAPPPDPAQPTAATNDTANADNLLSAVWQNNQLWTSATESCKLTNDTATRNCMRLIEVNTSSTPSVSQDLTLSTLGLDEYYPAVSLDKVGDLYVAYTASSSGLDPGAYAVISPAASIGTFTAPLTIGAGSAAYAGGTNARWGDYSAAAPDPSAPGAVWVAGEYAPPDAASGDWGTAAGLVSLSAAPAPEMAVGAEGSDGQLWAQAPQLGSGWHPLGGRIIAPPAVAAAASPFSSAPAEPLFIGTGTDRQLWIRSAAASWQPVGAAQCIGGPGAVVVGGTLTVACRGTDNALWYNTAPWPGSAPLPAFTSPWQSLGGVLSAAPAIAPVGGVLTFFVRGTSGAIYTRTLASGYSATPWGCIGAPAAAVETASNDTYFACQGGDHSLWIAINGGAGWSDAVSQGGTLTGGPAVAAGSLETDILAEGTDKAVWDISTIADWHSLGGAVVGGVGAAALN